MRHRNQQRLTSKLGAPDIRALSKSVSRGTRPIRLLTTCAFQRNRRELQAAGVMNRVDTLALDPAYMHRDEALRRRARNRCRSL